MSINKTDARMVVDTDGQTVSNKLGNLSKQINIHKYTHLVVNDNWTSAIEQAIADIGINGGIIKFNARTYKVSQFTLPSKVSLWGEGKGQTILQYEFDSNKSANNRFISMGDRVAVGDGYGIRNVDNTFKDLTIKNNTTKTGTSIYACMTYSEWENVSIIDFDIAFDVTYSWTNRFNCVTLQGCRIAVRTGIQNNANSFVNCNFRINDYVFETEGSYNVLVSGSNIESTATCVIKQKSGGVKLNNFTFLNNYFENTCPIIDTQTDNLSISLNGVNFISNHIATNGTGLAIKTGSNTSWERSLVEANAFFRNNSDTTESLLHLEGTIRVDFGRNTALTFPSQLTITLLDSYTTTWNTGFITETIEYPNIKRMSGSYKVDKGVIVGETVNSNGLQKGYLIYAGTKKAFKLYNSNTSTDWVYIQTTLNGNTASRPVLGSSDIGYQYFDTTLQKPVYWDGSAWNDKLSRFVSVPATATATGQPGDWSADASYLYICHAANTWKRVAIAAW